MSENPGLSDAELDAQSAEDLPDREQMALVKKLAALNQSIAQNLGLSPEVLATRRDIEQLAEGFELLQLIGPQARPRRCRDGNDRSARSGLQLRALAHL